MSINLGLSPADKVRLDSALVGDHNVRVIVSLLNLNEAYLADLSPLLYDGQVTINASGEISRSASLTLFDPNRILSLDGTNPTDSALYFDKMVSITYCVWQWDWDKSIDIPIFRGPITNMKRSGNLISLDAFGKEILSLGAIWSEYYVPKGSSKNASLRDMLLRSGERKFDLQAWDSRLPRDVNLGPESVTWTEAKKIASSNTQLFYNGRGIAVTRSRLTAPLFEFKNLKGGSILTRPDVSYDMDAARNLVWVKGAKNISQYATLPSNHPLNHNKIGRNGMPRYLLEVITDTTIGTSAEAKALAQRKVNERALQAMSAQTTTFVIPYLEEYDPVRLTIKDEYSFVFNLNEMAIPLVPSQSATIGSRRNLKIKKR